MIVRSTIMNRWNNPELKRKISWWLCNGVSNPRGRRFHSRKNTSYEKYSLEFISTFWRNISLSLEELVPVMVSQWELSILGRWHSFCYDRFFFHMSHYDKLLMIKHVFIVVWNISSLGLLCWRVLSDCAIMKLEHHVAWLPPDRQAWEMIWKYSLHLIFTFYLNTDKSVVEFSPAFVFQ